MPEFLSVKIEGPFGRGTRAGTGVVGFDRLDDVLRPYEGRQVRLSLHMRPPTPPLPDKWGGGCCLWDGRPEGTCPAGHHLNPLRMVGLAETGVLARTAGGWSIGSPPVDLPLGELDEHFVCLAVATLDHAFDEPAGNALHARLGEIEAALAAIKRR